MYITAFDLINSYAINCMSEVETAQLESLLPVLAREDACSLREFHNVGFVAFQIAEAKKRGLSLNDQYSDLCSNILMIYGKLPDHLIAMSQNMDLFSEYLINFEFYLKIKLAELKTDSVPK